jgi:hypothetical protein
MSDPDDETRELSLYILDREGMAKPRSQESEG